MVTFLLNTFYLTFVDRCQTELKKYVTNLSTFSLELKMHWIYHCSMGFKSCFLNCVLFSELS